MGMGDGKKPLKRDSRLMMCDKCRTPVPRISIRNCPHPSVKRVYGDNQSVSICIYCCCKCKFAERVGLNPGLGCSYGK